MRLPWNCRSCQALNMVEMETLDRIKVDVFKSMCGYWCEGCGEFQKIYITTNSLDEALEYLDKLKRTHSKFNFFFKKVAHKAIQLQVRYNKSG